MAYPPLGDVLADHLTGCEKCQVLMEGPPFPNLMTKTSTIIYDVCSERMRLIREWAVNEGRVNNIVAHDEYGNKARRES
jgi:hypothetical protein